MALQLTRAKLVALHATMLRCTCIGAVYNRCTPHESWCGAGGKQTPAMAAGITDHSWTIQELLSCHIPSS